MNLLRCVTSRMPLRLRMNEGVAMSVYLIAQINIHDRDRYGQYEAGFMEIFAQYGGEMLAVDESPTVLEGQWPHTRTVLIRFADKLFDALFPGITTTRLRTTPWL